jgi:hypothetical protein
MTWNGTHGWTSGEVVTAANLNTYVNDNLNALASPPFCDVYATTPGNTSGTAGTFTAIPFDSENADSTGTMHSTATQTSRITVPIDGLYHVEGGVAILSQANSINALRCFVALNGAAQTSTYASSYVPPSSSPVSSIATPPLSTYISATYSRYIRATANQYFELFVGCTATTVAIASASTVRPYLQVRWMGP